MNQQQLEQIVRSTVQELLSESALRPPVSARPHEAVSKPAINTDVAAANGSGAIILDIPDISTVNLQETLLVENPANREAYMELKRASPARLGTGRAGPRQNTATLLRFRADHAASMDTVLNDVPDKTIEDLGLFPVKSAAASKAEYLMDPGIGRVFDPETVKLIREKCKHNPKVQIIVSDGLSSASVENNIRDALPSLQQGLKVHGIDVGTNLFVKFGRVGIMDAVSEILNPDVAILFIGERPGLVTNESLSCYMAYKGYPGMAENMRTVVSNIYNDGSSPSESGAHIADIAKKMIEQKASGLDLKL
jgi:ethanolamine ammonia-lyase small subunit